MKKINCIKFKQLSGPSGNHFLKPTSNPTISALHPFSRYCGRRISTTFPSRSPCFPTQCDLNQHKDDYAYFLCSTHFTLQWFLKRYFSKKKQKKMLKMCTHSSHKNIQQAASKLRCTLWKSRKFIKLFTWCPFNFLPVKLFLHFLSSFFPGAILCTGGPQRASWHQGYSGYTQSIF